jgi:PAS domain S-box-containing protein
METRLQALADASARIFAARTLAETLHRITEAARDLVGAHQAVTSLTAGPDWSQAIQSVLLSDKYAAWRAYDEAPSGKGIYAKVCAENRAIRLTQAELGAHPAWRGFGAAKDRHPPMRGWLAVPLVARDGANLGLVQLSDKHEGEFDAADEAILVQLARLGALAVENSRLVEAARSAERRFESFAKLGNEVLWETDAQHRYTSFVATGGFGLPRPQQDFIGRTRWEALEFDPADPFWAAHIAELEAHRPLRGFEYRFRHCDGKLRWLRLNAEPQFDAAGRFTGYRGATQDVTELRAAEAAAKANEERFRQFAEIASDWLWETDAEHRFTYFAGSARTFDRRPYGKTRWDLVGADATDPKWRAHLADLAARRPFRDFEYAYTDKTGRLRHIVVSGNPVLGPAGAFLGYRGTARDLTAQREAEDAARKAAEQYRTIVETAAEGVWMLDANARTTFVNARMAEMLGYRPEEMLGREVYEFRPPEDRQGRERRWDRRVLGIGEQREARFVRRDGSVFWAQVSAASMKDANGNFAGALGMVSDITARKEAEAALGASEQRFRDFAEVGADWLWETDAEHRLTLMEGPAPVAAGFALGKRRWEYGGVDPAAPEWRRFIETVGRREPFRNFEYEVRGTDGRKRHFALSGKPVFGADGAFLGYRGTTHDITAQRDAEAAARESERKFRTMVETAHEGIWMLDADRRTTYVNPRMAEMLGYAPEEMLGRHHWDFMAAEDRAAAIQSSRQRLGDAVERVELRYLRKDGSPVWVIVTSNIVEEPASGRTAVLGMVTDITDRKAAEQAAAASEARFRDFAEIASDWMWETDRDHRLTYVSGEALSLENEPLGRTRWELAGADADDPHWRAHIADLEARRPFREFEFTVKGRSGRLHHLAASGRPIYGDDGAFMGYRGTTTNRTQQREAEAAAAASERQFRQLVETAQEGIWIVDADFGTTYVNRRMADMLGYTVEEIGNRPILDFMPRGDHARIVEAWHRYGRSGINGVERRMLHKDGGIRWMLLSASPRLDADGKFVGAFGMLVDITERKAAEQALARAKRELDAILENTSDGIANFDNAWRYTYMNAPGERITGLRAADVVGVNCFERFGIGRDNVFLETYRQAKQDGCPVWFAAHSDFYKAWHEVRALPHADGITVFFRDVTAERRRQSDLAESERKLRAALENNQSILESISDGFVALDNEWRFTFVNPAAERIWNVKAADLLGKTLLNALQVDASNAFHVNYLESKRTGDPVAFAAYFDIFGKWIEVRGYPHPGGYTLFFDDVSEERRAHRALLRSQKKLEAAREMNERLFETSLDLICVTDRAGNFVEVNPGAARQFGYAKEELVGHNASEFIDAEGIVTTREAMRGARRSQSLHTFENKCRRKDGNWVPVNWSVAWSEREQKYFLIGRDMSEQIAQQERLNRSQRLEAIGQLTGGIAHDFNNLLTVIMGNSDALARGLAGREHLRRRAELSLEAARRAAELTAQLLAFARRQTLAPKAVDANRLVADMHELMHRTLGAHIEIAVVAGAGLWLCRVDSTQLETALLNLALNARDAMPGGGRLTIATSNRTIPPREAGGGANGAGDIAAGDYVAIEVADTGSGMTPEVMARAFEPFFTTKEIGKGSGLGLAMVYGFVKQSGGGVAIESAPGRGTKVTLHLPRAAETAAAERPQTAEGAPLPGGRETILVVEDDPAVRDLVTDQLRALGYRVLVAGNGFTARNILYGGETVDLLFTDVMMPGGITGAELAAEADERIPGLKILFTTGYADVPALANARRGVALLRKPYKIRDLARTVRETLDTAA